MKIVGTASLVVAAAAPRSKLQRLTFVKSLQLEATARELREANRLLKELDARKDNFLNQVSHELRTPMTSIRSFSEILLESA